MFMLEVYIDGHSTKDRGPVSFVHPPVKIFDDLDYVMSFINDTYGIPSLDGAALIINKIEDEMNMTYSCYINEIFPRELTEQELEELL